MPRGKLVHHPEPQDAYPVGGNGGQGLGHEGTLDGGELGGGLVAGDGEILQPTEEGQGIDQPQFPPLITDKQAEPTFRASRNREADGKP